jgi:hypothetical protein
MPKITAGSKITAFSPSSTSLTVEQAAQKYGTTSATEMIRRAALEGKTIQGMERGVAAYRNAYQITVDFYTKRGFPLERAKKIAEGSIAFKYVPGLGGGGGSVVKLPPQPPPQEQAEWETEAREIGADPFSYAQQKWMQKHGITGADVAKAGVVWPGVTTPADVEAAKTGNLPAPPTAREQAEWQAEAREMGITNEFGYAQQQWMAKHGLTSAGIAAADLVWPGMTIKQGKNVVPLPPPGTLAGWAILGEGQRGSIKVYSEHGEIITLTPDQSEKLFEAKGKEQFELMVELGILDEGAEFVPGKDGSWSYIPAMEVGVRKKVEDDWRTWQRRLEKGEIIQSDDGQYITKEDFESLPPAGQRAWKRGGFAALDAALATLQPYTNEKGEVLIVQALAEARYYDKPAIENAVEILFQPEAVDDAKDFIEENYYSGFWEDITFGLGRIPSHDKDALITVKLPEAVSKYAPQEGETAPHWLSRAWRQAMPWTEEVGENIHTAIEKYVEESAGSVTDPDTGEKVQIGTSVPTPKAVKEALSTAANWIDVKFIPWLWEQSEQAGEPVYVTDPETGEKHRIGSEIPGLEKVSQEIGELARPGIKAATDLFSIIPLTIVGTGASALLHSAADEKEQAVLAPALLAGGMLDWFAGRPRALATDLYGQGVYTTILILGPAKLARIAREAGVPFKPLLGRTSDTAIALEADIGRTKIAPGMTEWAGRRLVKDVETIWEGVGQKVPEGIRQLPPMEQAGLTAAIFNKDISLRNKGGGITGKVTPFQMAVPQAAWHAAGDITPFMKDLAAKGEFTTKPGVYGGYWLTQQNPQAFLARGKIGEPGSVLHLFSSKDFAWDLPPEVLAVEAKGGSFGMMKAMMEKLAEEGYFDKPGRNKIYTLFKWYWGKDKFGKRVPTYELELYAPPNFKFKALKPTWYAKELGGTASLKTESMVSFREPKLDARGNVVKDAKGNVVYTGNEIKAGQDIPILIVATEAALKEGRGVPSLARLYQAEAMRPYVAMKKFFAGQEPRPKVTEPYELAAEGGARSKYKAITLRAPKEIQVIELAKELFEENKGKPPKAFTNEDMVRLGEVLNEKGRVIKSREQIWHPDYPKEYGFVYSRVTALVRDPKTGDIFLFRDRSEPSGVYGTIGGHLDPRGKSRLWETRGREGKTPEEAIREQALDEIGVDLTNVKRQPLYFGKTTRHSLHGTYVFTGELKPGGRIRLSKEIPEYIRLKSGSEATVFPATYDLIKGLARNFDTSNLKVYRGFGELLKQRDAGYAKRVKGLREGKVANERLAELEINRRLREEKERTEAKLKEEDLTPPERRVLEERARDIEKRLREEEIIPGRARREYKVPGIKEEKARAAPEKRPEPKAESRPEPKPEPRPEPRPELKAELESEPRTEPEPKTPYKPPYKTPYKSPPPKEVMPTPPKEVPPAPPPEVPPEVPPERPPVAAGVSKGEEKRQEFKGAITWRQGFGWWSIKAPYESQADVAFFKGEPPPNAQIVKGGPKSAFRSIQTITGKAPEKLRVDLGIYDVLVRAPKKKPGAPGAIEFKRDVEQKTTGDITITSTGRGKPRVTKSEATETLEVNPTGSSKMPADIAKKIGSVSAKVTSDGKVKLKVKRL